MRPKREQTLHEMAKSVMSIVHDVAARRLCQALEEAVESRIKPLEAENARLRALLEQHGVKA